MKDTFQVKKRIPVKRSFKRPVIKWNKSTLGLIFIQSTHNNTLYTLADHRGSPRNWISAGRVGFKNTRKSTGYASQAAAEKLAALAKQCEFRVFHIIMKGLGPGKQSGVRALFQSGLRVVRISESTTLPHNGCRPPKKRRT